MAKDTPPGWPPEDDSSKGSKARRPGSGPRPLGPLGTQNIEPKRVIQVVAGLFAVIFLFLFLRGRLGIAQITDSQVGVLVSYLGGGKEVIVEPGFRIYMPGIQEMVLFDKSSQEFVMEGERFSDNNHVPRLTVRAVDGSNFWFERITIQYQIVPGMADLVLEDSGEGEGFKQNWIKAYARSVLRDEFGRFTAVEAADPTQYKTASDRSRQRLNELLEPHGMMVTLVTTPKPKFDDEYERAIELRKVADQEVQVQKEQQEQLVQERARALSMVLKEKEIEMQELTGELRKVLLTAEQDTIRLKRAADAYAIERKKSGEGQLAEALAQARGLEAKYTKEAEGLTAKAEALEQRGRVVVREALVQKLASIRFTFLPYSRDPAPTRLEHVQATKDGQLDESTLEEAANGRRND